MTDGVNIIGTLLRAFVPLTQIVPINNIKAGALPDNVTLPALLVREVSQIERHVLQRQSKTRTVDRISVTVRAASYRDQKAIMKQVKACCAGRTGDIGGGESVAILTAGRSPDVRGPGDSFEQAQDLKVSYLASE